MESLTKLGFDPDFFIGKEDIDEGFYPARIVTVNKNSYQIHNGNEVLRAELSGKMLFEAEDEFDYPAVGDWIIYQSFEGSDFQPIFKLLERKTLLKRKTAGKKISHQLIASNIDTAFIVMALDNNFKVNRLERYLVLTSGAGITPVLLLTKSDLISQEELAEKICEIEGRDKNIEVIPLSNISGAGVEQVKEKIKSGETYCLLGSSGVGKTSLLNNLTEGKFAVKEVREADSRGRHTTTRRELIMLESGGIIIDTPGMRELGNFGSDEGIELTFDEITNISENCKFRDCTHTNEVGCAVLEAVESDEISRARYENFMKLRREAAHYDTSYVEKRKKDKATGKMYKSIMNVKLNLKGERKKK
ncbi:MAG: putative ribosome biogenesis GTPase RsgA [Melioribacteraceae bacterium]|nr:MAG: putative ribosome biogenesis GTPase RsgA [Melioribacteraceae bacterium]